jgi:hypothetical protein
MTPNSEGSNLQSHHHEDLKSCNTELISVFKILVLSVTNKEHTHETLQVSRLHIGQHRPYFEAPEILLEYYRRFQAFMVVQCLFASYF